MKRNLILSKNNESMENQSTDCSKSQVIKSIHSHISNTVDLDLIDTISMMHSNLCRSIDQNKFFDIKLNNTYILNNTLRTKTTYFIHGYVKNAQYDIQCFKEDIEMNKRLMNESFNNCLAKIRQLSKYRLNAHPTHNLCITSNIKYRDISPISPKSAKINKNYQAVQKENKKLKKLIESMECEYQKRISVISNLFHIEK